MAYTKAQEARLIESAPISYDDAVALGVELGYSTRSVIAKTKSLELDYIPKPVPAKRPAVETKAELVEDIEDAFGFDLTGLTGATAAALATLRDYAVTAEV